MASYLTQFFAEKDVTFEQVTVAGHTVTRQQVIAVIKGNPRVFDPILRDLDYRNGDIDEYLRVQALYLLANTHGLVPLGTTLLTPGAQEVLNDTDENAADLFTRHVCGDWGSIGKYAETEIDDDVRRRGVFATANGAKLNKLAIELRDGRIMSSYQVSTGDTLWVMTEADWVSAPVTTIMTPEEY